MRSVGRWVPAWLRAALAVGVAVCPHGGLGGREKVLMRSLPSDMVSELVALGMPAPVAAGAGLLGLGLGLLGGIRNA